MLNILSNLLNKFQTLYQNRKDFLKWSIDRKSVPVPHIVKQHTIKKYKKKFKLDILIESGTYLGQMVEAQRKNFQKIISIELSQVLYESARNKFKEFDNIEIKCGDSGKLMKSIVDGLQKPAIFWLDGHYSAGVTAQGEIDTPIIEEINSILQSDLHHIILIDDARLFGSDKDYPTVESLKNIVEQKGYSLAVKNDIIHLVKFENY